MGLASRYRLVLVCWLALAAGCASENDQPETPAGAGGFVAPIAGGNPISTGSGGGVATVNPVATGAGGMNSMVPIGPVPTPTGAAPMPCDVAGVVKTNCQSCHSDPTKGGAPMPLVTAADFQKDYTIQTTRNMMGQKMKVHEISRVRINSEGQPMPPGGTMQDADHMILDNWLAAGAIAGTQTTCETTTPGTGGTGSVDPMKPGECNGDTAYLPLTAVPGETCYEFRNHNGQTMDDTSEYSVKAGEHYEQFYFKVPWPTGSQGTRYGARYDNIQALHHWLLFTTALPYVEGSHETTTGSQFFAGDTNAELIGGWAVGGCNVTFPPEMGFRLPPKDSMLNLQWHFYNNTPAPVTDGTAVQVCVVPPGTRPNEASMTWLGTEFFNGPAGMPPGENKFGGTCINETTKPITIWAFWPHMHEIGRHMNSVVTRAGSGMKETVFDKPFDFNRQIHYENKPNVVLMPGDSIHSTCTFMNDTGANVAFGPSTKQEMCYQFAFSYPAGALSNGVLSLIGASNTCWQPGQ